MGGSSSQQPVTQQTTQTRDPWVAAQPSLSQIIGQAGNLFNSNTGYVPYTGQTQAGLDPNLELGLASQAGIAKGYQGLGGTAGNAAAQQEATNMIQNQGLSPELRSLYQQAQGDQNPFLNSIIDTSNRRIGDRINSSMSGAGRYGSGQHTDVMARALAESADPLLAQDYARRQQQQQDILTGGLQRAGQWAQLQPTLEAAQYAPAERLASAGQYGQDRAQSLLNDQIKEYNAQQARDWEQLSRWNAIVGGAGGLGGSQVTTSPIQQPSTLQRVLGGGIAGAGLGSMFGAPGAAIGGIGGGLMGLL